jgi:hypothetical protein
VGVFVCQGGTHERSHKALPEAPFGATQREMKYVPLRYQCLNTGGAVCFYIGGLEDVCAQQLRGDEFGDKDSSLPVLVW